MAVSWWANVFPGELMCSHCHIYCHRFLFHSVIWLILNLIATDQWQNRQRLLSKLTVGGGEHTEQPTATSQAESISSHYTETSHTQRPAWVKPANSPFFKLNTRNYLFSDLSCVHFFAVSSLWQQIGSFTPSKHTWYFCTFQRWS